MKRYRRIKALLGVILLAIISLLPANKVFAKPQLDFNSAVSYGYNQPLLVGDSAPFTIKITNNNSSNFEGFLQVIVPGYSNNNTLYEEKITLGPNETKSVNMVIGIPVNTDFINIRMANKKGKVVWSELTKISCAHTKTDIRVGVLTDDFSALSYIDRTHFLSDDTRYLSLIELNLDTFPTDYYALESFDCILITDFPTDLLTKEQIDALRLWIQKGGFLIIGTGSTASKTLSGLKGTITNVNVSSTVNRSTTLGLENADYSYINLISSSSTNNGYYQAEFFYYDNYYYKPNDYAYEPWDDDDGDGYNDYVGAFGGDYDYNGDYYDAYGQYVAPEYEYLFADDAFYQDSNGAYHYKYYDERYGRVDEDNDEYKDLLKEYSQYDLIDTQGYNEYCNLWGFDPRWFIYEYLGIQDMDEIDDMLRIPNGNTETDQSELEEKLGIKESTDVEQSEEEKFQEAREKIS